MNFKNYFLKLIENRKLLELNFDKDSKKYISAYYEYRMLCDEISAHIYDKLRDYLEENHSEIANWILIDQCKLIVNKKMQFDENNLPIPETLVYLYTLNYGFLFYRNLVDKPYDFEFDVYINEDFQIRTEIVFSANRPSKSNNQLANELKDFVVQLFS